MLNFMERKNWTREELIVAFNLYCKIPFGKINYHNEQIIKLAKAIGRTPSAVAWKLVNFASFDPTLKERNIKGATNAGKLDKVVFEEFYHDWDMLAYESEILLSKFLNQKIELGDEQEIEKIILKEGKTRDRLRAHACSL